MAIISMALFDDLLIASDKTGGNPSGFNIDDDFDSKLKGSISILKKTITTKHCFCSVSMGKDSSVMALLTVMAMSELENDGVAYKRVYFLSVNTGMESPAMDAYTWPELRKLERHLEMKQFNAELRVVMPRMHESHLVSAIGGRIVFAMPQMNAKCAVDLKITPMKREKVKIAKELGFKSSEIKHHFASLVGTRFVVTS